MPGASATKIISLSILSFLTTASAYTTVGCYSSPGQLTSAGTFQFQSEGYCQQICTKQNKAIFALHNGDECYCGDALPPSTAKVSSTQCQTPCSGFPSETCGGINAWLINNSTTVSQPTTDDDKLVTELKRESTDNVENGIVIAPESDDDSDSSSGTSNSPDTMKVNPTMVETGIAIAPSSAADGGAAKSTVPSVILTAPSMTGVTVPATGAAGASSMVVAASSASASATATASGAASSGSAATSPSTSVGAAAGAVAGAPASGMIGGVVMAAVVALGL
ncbi:hypothetical protein AbraIFM66950_008695 [Aspergillus brasiliensis]|nr:hypothetical protein AbraIFM66950_008695 [Aspergillus brasiliensis]